MIKYTFTLIFLLYISCNTEKKTINNDDTKIITENQNDTTMHSLIQDTLSYVKNNFINHKEKYINKELNLLLNDLEIQVKSYTIGIADNNISICPYISLSFLDTDETSRRIDQTNKPAIIGIEWKIPVPDDSTRAVLAKSTNKGEWQKAEQEFYGKQIVKNIVVTEWPK